MKGIILAGGSYKMGYIDKAQLHRLAKPLLKSGYGEYLLQLD